MICKVCGKTESKRWRTGKCLSCYEKESYPKRKAKRNQQNKDWMRTLNGQWHGSKNKAKQLNQNWNLTFEQYAELRTKSCHYCEGPLPVTSKGLDRIDNSKGYEIDNVVPCCRFCNVLRSNLLSTEETLAVVKLLKQMRG